ncbi:aspartic peptidase domain-containing protein [Mycena galericulata]|nr:aspartic peptidase domain-containing protein [Mycena galericulata]
MQMVLLQVSCRHLFYPTLVLKSTFSLDYKIWSDFIYLRPLFRPAPEDDPNNPWFHLEFGVAHEVSHHFEYSPASGILGLGRRISSNPGGPNSQPLTFLDQVRDRLQSPEFTILLAETKGYVTFGRRAVFPATQYPWHLNLPVTGKSLWSVSSTVKELNGVRYAYEGGEAELDTGAAFCYLSQDFVDAFYSCVPGFVMKPMRRDATANRLPQNVYYIPTSSSATPVVKLDIGGHMFTLELLHLPHGMEHVFGTEKYHVGAIQSKNLLALIDNRPYHGPDLIGRVALMNMEVVFQMPNDKPHTISWRRKDRDLTGLPLNDW